MLSSAVRNLLENAVRHNDEETPVITVSHDERPEKIRLRIADNGSEVPDSQNEEIFGQGKRNSRLQRRFLAITGHTSTHAELPELITETDIITHHGYQYELHFEEDPYAPSTLNRITLYAPDTIHGMNGVPLENGLATAADHIQELLNREDAPAVEHST